MDEEEMEEEEEEEEDRRRERPSRKKRERPIVFELAAGMKSFEIARNVFLDFSKN